MPVIISKTFSNADDTVTFRLAGEGLAVDVPVLRQVIDEALAEGHAVVIDIADLDLMDGEAASLLRRYELDPSIRLIGREIFLQNAVDDVDGR